MIPIVIHTTLFATITVVLLGVITVTLVYPSHIIATATTTPPFHLRGPEDHKDRSLDGNTSNTAKVYIVRHGEKTYGKQEHRIKLLIMFLPIKLEIRKPFSSYWWLFSRIHFFLRNSFKGGGCLNIQGQERANNFPQLFNSTNKNIMNTNDGAAAAIATFHNIQNKNNNTVTTTSSIVPASVFFETPTAIFANNYFNTWGNCERCLLTVLPLSQAIGVPIDFEHGFPDKFGSNKAGAKAIYQKIVEQQQQQNSNSHNEDDEKMKPSSVVLVAWEHYNIQFLTAELGVPEDTIPYWDDDDYDTVYVLTFHFSSTETGKTIVALHFEVRAQTYVPKSTTCDPAQYIPPPGWNPPATTVTTTTNTTAVMGDDFSIATSEEWW